MLLLDEADIFLQKRDKADIKRNAIVSVLLRTLEYYSVRRHHKTRTATLTSDIIGNSVLDNESC